MIQYIIAGAIGFVVAKLFEEDKAPKYADGGELLSDEMVKHISYLNELLKNDNAGSLKFAIKSIDDIISTETSSIDLQEYKTLQKEIKKNGVVPILIDESNSTIIDGNHRWKLLNKMGIKNIPVFELKANDNFWENDDLYMEFDYQYKNETPLISINKYADGGSVLLAPNGKPSNLTPKQYKLVRTSAFKEWFGDWENDPLNSSKVIDEETKEPLVVYHGSLNDFTVFDEYKIGDRTRFKGLRNGIYFSSKIYSAKTFGEKIYEVFLNLKNPHIIDLIDGKNITNAERELRDVEWTTVRFEDKYTKGFIIKNTNDTLSVYDDLEIIDIFIVNNSSHIKLADGTNTTFDGNNPDIRFDGGGDVKELSKKQKKEIILIQNKVFADGLPTYKLSADGNWVMSLDVRTNRYKSYQDFNSFYDRILEMEREKYARENAQKVFEYLDDSGAELLNKSIYGSRYYIYKNNHIRVSNHDYQSQQTDRETGLPKYKYYKHNFFSYEKDGWQKIISEIESLKNPDIRFDGGGSVNELKFSNEIESDAMGYDIGDYLYHITPVSNFDTIINKGFIPKNGVAINGKPFENRLYFATSLISAYDLSVNFGSYRDDTEYVIFKIKSDCIDDYEEDNLFAHGIYIDYKISNKCILGYVNANDLFNKFDDEDLENLYY
jgi:hypothetical protein